MREFDVITFDCYGTLIDWESGILAAVQPVLMRHGVQIAPAVGVLHPHSVSPNDHRVAPVELGWQHAAGGTVWERVRHNPVLSPANWS